MEKRKKEKLEQKIVQHLLEQKIEKVFIICPVRNLTPEEDKEIKAYIGMLESKGIKVHYPPRDTNQNDSIGLRICSDNKKALRESDRIDIYLNSSSSGTLFDFGMAFAFEKPIYLINRDDLKPTDGKRFVIVLLALDELYKKKYNNSL